MAIFKEGSRMDALANLSEELRRGADLFGIVIALPVLCALVVYLYFLRRQHQRRRIIGTARPISGLRSAAVVAKQRDNDPVTYYMIGPQRATREEADADLERWRRAQISASFHPCDR